MTLGQLVRWQGGRCFYCSGHLVINATRDHVIPVTAGGRRFGRKNRVAACLHCNRLKGARPPSAAELQRLADLNRIRGFDHD